MNIGFEQNGGKNFERIVIVLKKFTGNFVLIAPITKSLHQGNWYLDIDIFNKKHKIILNQIKPIDTKRLNNGICQISEKEVKNILYKYKEIL